VTSAVSLNVTAQVRLPLFYSSGTWEDLMDEAHTRPMKLTGGLEESIHHY
jgi:hypothetical protein